MSFFNFVLLFSCSFVLLSANGEPSSKGETFIVSSFSYPRTRLRPFDLRYIRGLSPNSQHPFLFNHCYLLDLLLLWLLFVLKHYLSVGIEFHLTCFIWGWVWEVYTIGSFLCIRGNLRDWLHYNFVIVVVIVFVIIILCV